MKTQNLLIALAVLAGVAFGQPSRGVASVSNPVTIHLKNDGMAYPALREALDSGRGQLPYLIHLDTLEVDTAYLRFNVLEKPVFSYSDTVGTISFAVKDSTGTDTAAIRMYWYGNARPDGRGQWFKVDSLDCKDLTSTQLSSYKTCSKVVTSTGGFSLLQFRAYNVLSGNANRKSTIKDPIFITKRRMD